MINVYCSGADRDKDRFMFDRIMQRLPADVILLVPDQFTLQAERNAFEYMNTDTLLELEIMSLSGFKRRVTAGTGEPAGIPVNKYGRYMLLTGLMLEQKKKNKEGAAGDGREGIFSAVNQKRSFMTLLNDQISELKQYNIAPEELRQMAGEFADDEILADKLKDIYDVYERYERLIDGKFTDTEDYQKAVNEKIKDASFVKRSIFFIDGFDYLTPRLMSMIEEISASAVEVNVMLTGSSEAEAGDGTAGDIIYRAAAGDGEFFRITRNMTERLREAAKRAGTAYHEEAVPDTYRLFSAPEICIMSAGDFYAEAESIAADILRLVREKGCRYRDIAVICNDSDKRGSVFRRVFDRCGIPLFIDKKRNISQEPGIEFILSLIAVIHNDRRFDDIFRMLKTGLGPVDDEECEILEKYCRKYNIRSGHWKKDFVYGRKDEGEERLARINDIRRRVDEFTAEAEALLKDRKTVRARCEGLYSFLAGTAGMPARCEAARALLEEQKLFEEAESVSQIWKTVISILDQLVEVLGDAEPEDEEFIEILREGFEEVEIGLIPTNNDQVIFGTMQRTRTGRVRALFVAGANDGVLPESGRTDGLLSDDEKQLITDKLRRISKTDELRTMEQDLAIYKNLTKASELLCISYAGMDADGTELRPSELVERLLRLSTEAADGSGAAESGSMRVRLKKDYISSRAADALLQAPASAAGHTAAALRRYLSGEEPEDIWKAAALVLDGTREFESARKGLFYNNKTERLKKSQVKELFGRGSSKELIVSTSGIERYSRCPFSFFVTYGLRPEEERSFEADMRSIGDIYHECMRRIADALTERGIELSSPDSGWMRVTPAECRSMASHYVEEFTQKYREGLFTLTGREAYIRERLKEICFQAAWLMIEQVKRGHVKAVYFEQRFGRRRDALFPPVRLELDGGEAVYIEGIIDRIDIISGQENAPEESGEEAPKHGSTHDYIRVIDYKSGYEKFDLDEVRSGWRLQLMLYLKGAMSAVADSRPAGVFYFAIKEPRIDVTSVPDDRVDSVIDSALLRSVRLDGALLNNESVIAGMDSNIAPKTSSDVLPVHRRADGQLTGSTLLTDAEFAELIKTNDDNLHDLAAGLISGCIDLEPGSGKSYTACRYCGYHGICRYE